MNVSPEKRVHRFEDALFVPPPTLGAVARRVMQHGARHPDLLLLPADVFVCWFRLAAQASSYKPLGLINDPGTERLRVLLGFAPDERFDVVLEYLLKAGLIRRAGGHIEVLAVTQALHDVQYPTPV